MSTKNDIAWEKLFDKLKIIKKITSDNHFIITSDQINKFRESRLMTKFDHTVNLPQIFSANNLSILPLTRGSYIIGHFDSYQKVEYKNNLQTVSIEFPDSIESLDYNNLYSEAAALNCAFVSGILNDLINEDLIPTISGRMSSSEFTFFINNVVNKEKYKVDIKNSQCEIDGGYESNNSLLLIETKNHLIDDFNIRQVYYPYRLWSSKVSKKVVPAFLTFSNNIFSFFVYEFTKLNDYNSCNLLFQRNYKIESPPIKTEDILDIFRKAKITKEPEIPFPQADTFERVIDLLNLLMSDDLPKDFITTNYDFDERQTNYYTSACLYLGLIDRYTDKRGVVFSINGKGRAIMSLSFKQKYLSISALILEHEVFYKSLKLYFKKAAPISRQEVFDIMKKSNIYNVKEDSTFWRRAQTVLKWIDWILDLPNK